MKKVLAGLLSLVTTLGAIALFTLTPAVARPDAVAVAAPPGPFASVILGSDKSTILWNPLAEAQIYDVTFGDLGLLRSSDGDYTATTLGCAASGTIFTSVNPAADPALGQALWFLVRGDNSAGAGTYDSGVTRQVGSRDAEIDGSPFSCHHAGTCGNGTCDGAESCVSCLGDCAAVYLDEDFSDNSAGWTLGSEWEIGPAQASQCGESGGDDPDTDHSNSVDNGVAGVVLGGCAVGLIHPYAYLQSPAFNTSTASNGIVLSFYRWLNSDQTPFMTSDIEVWDGSQWVVVWIQPTDGLPLFDSPIAGGPGWNFQQLDLTPYKNATMKIRFGFKIEDPQVYSVGSWNIDDIRVSSPGCP